MDSVETKFDEAYVLRWTPADYKPRKGTIRMAKYAMLIGRRDRIVCNTENGEVTFWREKA